MMNKQTLIVLHGLTGTGKSTVTELIKFELKPSVVLGSDRLRFHITDFKGTEKATYFDLTRDIMMGMVSDYLDKGFTVIAEDQFKKEHIEKLKQIAGGKKIPFLSYELTASDKIRGERLTVRETESKYIKPEQEFRDWQYDEYINNKYTESKVFNTETTSEKNIAKEILADVQKSSNLPHQSEH